MGLLAVGAASAALADASDGLARDARRYVGCLKAFDARCLMSIMYLKPQQDRGATDNQIFRRIDQQLKSSREMGARYTRFDLQDPWDPLPLGGLLVAFVPYESDLELRYRTGFATTSYLVGISEDEGATWRFVDGTGLSGDDLAAALPGFSGQPLPPVSVAPLEGK